MELEELVAKFTANAGLQNIPPVAGVWKFSADGNVFGVTADEKGGTVWLYGEIPSPSPDRNDALLKAAMEANHFRRGTGGGTFSLNPDTGVLTLADSRPLATLDEETFYAFVERFVNALATWKGLASAAAPSIPSAPPPPPVRPLLAHVRPHLHPRLISPIRPPPGPRPLSLPLLPPTNRKGAARCRTPGSNAGPTEQPSLNFRRCGFQPRPDGWEAGGKRLSSRPACTPPASPSTPARRAAPHSTPPAHHPQRRGKMPHPRKRPRTF